MALFVAIRLIHQNAFARGVKNEKATALHPACVVFGKFVCMCREMRSM